MLNKSLYLIPGCPHDIKSFHEHTNSVGTWNHHHRHCHHHNPLDYWQNHCYPASKVWWPSVSVIDHQHCLHWNPHMNISVKEENDNDNDDNDERMTIKLVPACLSVFSKLDCAATIAMLKHRYIYHVMYIHMCWCDETPNIMIRYIFTWYIDMLKTHIFHVSTWSMIDFFCHKIVQNYQ